MRVPSRPKMVTPIKVHQDLAKVINGGIDFGNPQTFRTAQSTQNINGAWWQGTSPGTPDTDFAVTHTLGTVPVGYDVKKQDKAAHVYAGVTPWTSTVIYLRTDQPSVTLTLFVI